MNRPIWQRLLVLFAGVFMNITLALFIFLCIYMNLNYYTTNQISADTLEQVLSLYNLKVGDRILKINGEKIYNDQDVIRILEGSESDDFEFEIEDPNGKVSTINSKIPKNEIGFVGIVFDGMQIYGLTKDGAGEKAGLEVNDKILSVNDKEYDDINDVITVIKENPNKEIKITVNRDGYTKDFFVTPKSLSKRNVDLQFVDLMNLDFAHNLYYAWNETKFYLRINFIGIGELLTGKTENVEVQGIVGISKEISQTESLIEFFYLMSAISMSLGIMNLLPIPGLDGGKILITLIEIIRRKPMSKETEAKITLVGFAFLLILMIFVTFSDITKLF